MSASALSHRLAAILAADAAGYSRLMSIDDLVPDPQPPPTGAALRAMPVRHAQRQGRPWDSCQDCGL